MLEWTFRRKVVEEATIVAETVEEALELVEYYDFYWDYPDEDNVVEKPYLIRTEELED